MTAKHLVGAILVALIAKALATVIGFFRQMETQQHYDSREWKRGRGSEDHD